MGGSVSAIVGGITGPAAAQVGADAQTQAAQIASQTEMNMFNTTQSNLKPYMQSGVGSTTALQGLTGSGTSDPLSSALLKAPTMDEATLQQTPGYQFNLNQGLESAQNSYAARGLGSSGAAVKGAETYATGLADSTYQNQYANAVTNQTNQFNRLMSLSTLGENAAAGVGVAATQTGANIASNQIGAGNASAAAAMATGNAISGAAQTGFTNNLLQGMYGSGFGSGSGSAYVNSSPQSQVSSDVAEEDASNGSGGGGWFS